MIRYDCHFCGENVFDVVDIEHLDTLPRTWVCSGCGREYNGELDEEGNLIVYQKGYMRAQTLVAPGPVPEVTPEPEDVPAPGIEEPTEEQPEQAAAEKPEGEESVDEGAGEDKNTLPEVGAEQESAEEVE